MPGEFLATDKWLVRELAKCRAELECSEPFLSLLLPIFLYRLE